jgi:hypothetical protein
LIKNTKQSFVSDTQRTRAIAPATRFLGHQRRNATGLKRRSKPRFRVFAET